MPSKSEKQKRFMRLCAFANERKRKRAKCPPRDVAKEFVEADKKKESKK
ncbi:MAG: hypothetical protein ABIL76_07875 [candidate division WOR-3 bacterium]